MRIITRAEWGARQPKRRYTIKPTPRLWLHHFATNGWKGIAGMRECQRFHMDTKGWADIAYSFCVDNDTGVIYEGRGALVAGGHTADDNTTSHAICIMGNTHAVDLSPKAVRSIAWLTAHGKAKGWWTTPTITGSHRDAQAWGYSRKNGTVCAGDFAQARIPEINAMAVDGVGPAPVPELTKEDFDMPVNFDIEPHIRKTYADSPKLATGDEQGIMYWCFTVAEADKPKEAFNALRHAAGLPTVG